MSRNKREKNIIIFGSMMSILLFVVLCGGSIFVYNKVMEIEESKLLFSDTVEDYNNVKAKGLSYKEFKSLISKKTHANSEINSALSSDYTSNILNEVDAKFFKDNFEDNNGTNYNEHLNSIKNQIEYGGLKESFKDNDNKVSMILPIYSDNSEFYTDDSLTNFKFINSVERLLKKYGLSTRSTIGATELVPLESEGEEKKIINSIESDIFYIPLRLDISGRKSSILKFLNETTTMGHASYNGKELVIDNTSQILEVESVEMGQYIVRTPYTSNGEDDLISIVSRQGLEKFEMTVELRFYVVGVPAIKIKEKILEVIGDSLSDNIDRKISNLQSKEDPTEKDNSDLKDLIVRNDLLKQYRKLLSSSDLSEDVFTNIESVKNKIGHYESLKQLVNHVDKEATKSGNSRIKEEAISIRKTILGFNKDVKILYSKYRKGTNIEETYNESEQFRVIFASIDKKLLKLLSELK